MKKEIETLHDEFIRFGYTNYNYYNQRDNYFYKEFFVNFDNTFSNIVKCSDKYRYKGDQEFYRNIAFKVSLSWLLFSDYAKEHVNSKWMKPSVIPLPSGIHFGDSFQEVCKKLEIPEDVVTETNLRNVREWFIQNVFLQIQQEEGNVDTYIYLKTKKYSCRFYFYNKKQLLSSYSIGINKVEAAKETKSTSADKKG